MFGTFRGATSVCFIPPAFGTPDGVVGNPTARETMPSVFVLFVLLSVKHPSPTFVFAACSVVAYCASLLPGYLLPAVFALASLDRIHNVIHRALRPLSKLELLPPDLPRTAARVESWLQARDQNEAPLEPGAESSITWAAETGKQVELCVVYLHGWSASPPDLSPVPEQVAAALGATLLRYR